MSVSDELEKLYALMQSGAISEEEYEVAKKSLLSRHTDSNPNFADMVKGFEFDENTWGMVIHLSQFCGYLVPVAGLVVPIVLWQVKKNESSVIDKHGRIVVNWIITECLLGVLFFIMSFMLIGLPLYVILIVVSFIYPIVGGIKANNGQLWPYPFSIRFFRVH